MGGHRRRDIELLPQAVTDFRKLELPEVVHISELLEIPTIVAHTDLLGMFVLSMGSRLEKRGLRVLAIPVELPPLPIYMVWHEARRNDAGHRWLRELVAAELRRFDA